jgi:beta-galactosidase
MGTSNLFRHAALTAAALCLAGCAAATLPSASPTLTSSDPRPTLTLADGWRFAKSDVPGAQAADFNDASWQSVSLPHAWNVEDGCGGVNHGQYYRGPGWYRRKLVVDPAMVAGGRRVVLRFGAASLVADVYVNGKSVGTHRGGYAAFAFDVTQDVRAGDNELAVRVNNATDPNVTPLSGDFTIYGGLYRDVQLLSLPPVGISTMDEGSWGVYITPKVQPDGSGQAKIVTEIRNADASDASIDVSCALLDATGHEVARTSGPVSAAANGTTEVTQLLPLKSPHLWDGRRDPYLYSATIEVLRNGKVIDRVTQPLGFRTFSVDAEAGFTLNGKPYRIQGVNKHQGRPSVGYADTPGMRAQDFLWVKDLGATGIRLAHYQHPDDEYGWCDKFGIVCWAELALVNRMTDTPEFKDNAKQQLRELIKQSYNHPAIVFWSMYNEPAVNAKSGTQEQWKLIGDLVKLSHELDPQRLTTGAAVGGVNGPINWYMDVTGENRYIGWYGGAPEGWPKEIAAMKAKYAGRKIGMSEYGAGASVNQHEAITLGGPRPKANNSKWHPEEYQALVHEQAWAAMEDQKWLWGTFVWVMFDFASAGRNEGDRPGINDKGLVTADRLTPKDAYYFYKANWSDQPVLHLTDRRFNVRPPGTAPVKLYSNCENPRLWIGGTEIPLTQGRDHIFTATTDLKPGTTELRATATRDGKTLEDHFTWTITPGAATRQSTAPALAH